MICWFRGVSGGMLAGVVAVVVLALPGAALAWHGGQAGWDTLNAANGAGAPQLVCTSCHTLSSVEGEQGTSHLIASSRTLNLIKAFVPPASLKPNPSGGFYAVPYAMGCTYCHNTDINTKMKGVLTHFTSNGSKHPVGKNFVTGLETSREYLTSYNELSTTEVDCLDCHDVALINPTGTENGYVSHTDTIPASNPYMLKSVTVLNEYDNFCRTCHGTAASASYEGSGKDIRLGVTVGGIVRHGDALAAQILEDDGTNLRPNSTGGNDKCRACHDTHYSSKSVLYNDGHEKHKEGAVAVNDTPIVSTGDTSCTAVCHFPGDDDNYVNDTNNNYVNHGHGRATSTYEYSGTTVDFTSGSTVTMGMNCTSCHNSIDTSDTSATRRKHVTNPTGGTIQANYKGKFNLDNIPVQTTDTGSVYGNPVWGVCFQCHSSYEAHKTQTAGLNLGCQDCHDEHAENSGPGSNVFMIPLTSKPQGTYNTVYNGATPIRAKAGTEPVVYDTPRINPLTGAVNPTLDFFDAGGVPGAGSCDVAECHGAKGYTPATTYLASGNHSGGVITTAGADCANNCHTHKDDSGGAWRAQDSCSSSTAGCHGTASTIPANAYVQPNGTVFPDRAGKHAEHIARIVALNGTTNANDTTTCNWCHPNGAHSGDALTPAELHTGVATDFKTITGLNDANGAGSAANCSNVDCHYNTTVTIADWLGTPAMTCTYCHQSDAAYNAASNPLPNAHTKHVDEVADGGYNYACTNCHLDNGANMAHQDGTVAGDVLFSVTPPPWGNDADEVVGGTGTGTVKFGTGTAANYYTCAGVSCHGDFSGGNTANTPNWFNTLAQVGAATAAGRCGTCHGTTVGPAPMPNYADGTPKANKHPIHHTTEGYGCQVCHYATTTNGTSIPTPTPATHVNGDYTVDDDGLAPTLDAFTYAGGTCTVSECHGGVSVAWSRAASPDFTCDACHATTGGVKTGVTDVPNYTRDGATMSKINDIPTTGEFVTVGHGLAANGGKSCAACHDSAVPHDTTAGLTGGVNPFRLKDLTAGGALNFTCTDNVAGCHTTGLATDLAGVSYDQIRSHNATELIALGGNPKYDGAAGGWGFAPACVNCHDPHGDGANVAMMQREVYDKAAFNLPTQAPPALPTEQTALVFTDNAAGVGAGSFAEATTFSAICQECHEGTTPGTNTTHSFVDGVSATTASHTTSTDCTACHSHAGAFTPSGCSSAAAGCHGDGVDASWPLDAGSLSTQWPRRNGRHLPHMEALGQRFYTKTAATLTQSEQSYICDICHNDPLGVGGSGHNDASQPAQVGAFLRMWGVTPPTLPAADGGVASTYNAATYAGSTWNAGTAVCNNVDCHNEKATATPYEWYGAGTSPCVLCHTKGGVNTATLAHPSSGLHNLTATNTTAHDDAFSTSGDCVDCHIKANIPGHINGASLASGDFTAANVGLNTGVAVGNIGTYTELTVGNSRGSCASTTSMLGTANCHSDGGRWAREWNTDANADHRVSQTVTNPVCTVCHGTLNAWNAGMTVNHNLTNINNGTHGNCAQCHVLPTAPYVWTTHHDMQETGIRYVQTNSNAGTAYAAATGNCNNTCHTNDAPHTMGGSTIWANSGLAGLGVSCTSCHGYPPTTTGHAPGMTPVNHLLLRDGLTVANVTAVHNECDYCHGVSDNVTNDGFTPVNPASLGGNYTYSTVAGVDHKDGSVTMNGGPGAGYVAGSGWCSTAACHGADAAHALASGAPTATLRNFGPGLCQTCHQDAAAAAATGAPIVPYNGVGNHTNPVANTAAATEQCTACHTGHADGTPPAGVVEIPTRQTIGGTANTLVPTMTRQYSTHAYAINLGGTATTTYAKTEAQMCWGCHYDQTAAMGSSQSEFGVNNNATTGSMVYNYGTLSTWGAADKGGWYVTGTTTPATWRTAQRSAPNFGYKDGAIASMHGANYNAGGPGNDPVANIRCSYCHDVHNTGTAPTGQPYLRGTWKGNPFREDGAPQNATAYLPSTTIGAFPRMSKASTRLGGYNINENFSGGTADVNTTGLGTDTNINNWAGLCEYCHNSTGGATVGNGAWTATEIDNLDWGAYTTAGNNNQAGVQWAGSFAYPANATGNGHANSVLGGTGNTSAKSSDIYNERLRNSAWRIGSAQSGSGRPSMVYQNMRKANTNAYGFRIHVTVGAGANRGWSFSPRQDQVPIASRVKMYNSYNWGSGAYTAAGQVTATNGLLAVFVNSSPDLKQNKYHQFPCSKCHMPHASRLPRLMLTNCLDVTHATWSRTANTPYSPTQTTSTTNLSGDPLNALNLGRSWPETTAANNCHRVGAAFGRSGYMGNGWNRVTPW